MHKNTNKLKGKTILTIRKGSINCWNVKFTDGTAVSLWAEIDGPLGIGQLWLDRPITFKKAQNK